MAGVFRFSNAVSDIRRFIDTYKVIYNEKPQTWEYYDLELDPREENNLYDISSLNVQNLKKLLLKFLKENNIDLVLID